MKWTPDRIKSLRNAFGEKQEEFAKRFRVSIQTLQAWEQGKWDATGPATVLLDQLETELPEAAAVRAG